MKDGALRQLYKPTQSNVPALLWNLSAFGFAIASLSTGWPTAHPLWLAAIIVGLAYTQHCWTIIFHEDAHYSLYQAKWHNRFNGNIVGTLMFIPFDIFRNVHMRHHAQMNTPNDWEVWPYADPTTSLRFRRVFLVFDILFGAWVDPYIYNRIFFVKDSPIRDPKLRRTIIKQFLLIAMFWGTVIGLVTYFHWWPKFLVVYVIPAGLTGMIQTTRKLIEHLGLPAGDPMGGARTIMPKNWLGKMAGWTSFHIEAHGLHHAYPQMPHNHLEKAMELTETSSPDLIFPNYWRAFLHTLPHFRHPGIGENVTRLTPTPVGPALTANAMQN